MAGLCARACRPLLFTMELGFPGDQWTGPAPPTPSPSWQQLPLGGGVEAGLPPGPLAWLPGPGSLDLLLGWEQGAVAALKGGGYPELGNEGGCRDQGALTVTPLWEEETQGPGRLSTAQGDLVFDPSHGGLPGERRVARLPGRQILRGQQKRGSSWTRPL